MYGSKLTIHIKHHFKVELGRVMFHEALHCDDQTDFEVGKSSEYQGLAIDALSVKGFGEGGCSYKGAACREAGNDRELGGMCK